MISTDQNLGFDPRRIASLPGFNLIHCFNKQELWQCVNKGTWGAKTHMCPPVSPPRLWIIDCVGTRLDYIPLIQLKFSRKIITSYLFTKFIVRSVYSCGCIITRYCKCFTSMGWQMILFRLKCRGFPNLYFGCGHAHIHFFNYKYL